MPFEQRKALQNGALMIDGGTAMVPFIILFLKNLVSLYCLAIFLRNKFYYCLLFWWTEMVKSWNGVDKHDHKIQKVHDETHRDARVKMIWTCAKNAVR